MGTNLTIKWHGKAGQDAFTAAAALARVLAAGGKYVQAFPEFGMNKCGAPEKAFNRVSASPIRLHSLVSEADIEAVLNPLVLQYLDIKAGAKADAVYLFNTALSAETLKEKLNLEKNRIITFDAGATPAYIPLTAIIVRLMDLMPAADFKEKLLEYLPVKTDNGTKAEYIKTLDLALAGEQDT